MNESSATALAAAVLAGCATVAYVMAAFSRNRQLDPRAEIGAGAGVHTQCTMFDSDRQPVRDYCFEEYVVTGCDACGEDEAKA